ncbi:hypothetical protein FOZ63_018608, partial [Perkinsus olseni]
MRIVARLWDGKRMRWRPILVVIFLVSSLSVGRRTLRSALIRKGRHLERFNAAKWDRKSEIVLFVMKMLTAIGEYVFIDHEEESPSGDDPAPRDVRLLGQRRSGSLMTGSSG